MKALKGEGGPPHYLRMTEPTQCLRWARPPLKPATEQNWAKSTPYLTLGPPTNLAKLSKEADDWSSYVVKLVQS